jgi:hypothetical protein
MRLLASRVHRALPGPVCEAIFYGLEECMTKKNTRLFEGMAFVFVLVLALSGCPNGGDDNPDPNPSPGVTVQGAGGLLAAIRDADPALGGASADQPLTVKLSSEFSQAEFLALAQNKEYTSEDVALEMFDPLAGLFEAIASSGKYVALDMSEAGWTGLGEDSDMAFLDLPTNNTNAAAVLAQVRPGIDKLVSIKFPRKLKIVGANMFRLAANLKEVSFSGCNALTEIGTYAFANCGELKSLNVDGCSSLAKIQARAFYGCTALKGTNNTDTLDLTPLVKLSTVADYCFFGVDTPTIKLPAADALNLSQYAFNPGTRGEKVIFTGKNNVISTQGNFSFLDQPGSPYTLGRKAFPITHLGSYPNNTQGYKNDFVFEIWHEAGISWPRQFRDYFHHHAANGYFQAGQLIPIKNGQDVFRGQSSMTIEANVSGAPSATVDVYSRQEGNSQYKVGTMANGVITLAAPNAANLAPLDGTSGMQITIDPRNYHTTSAGVVNNLTNDFAVYNNAQDLWKMSDVNQADHGTAPAPDTTLQGYWWQPNIGNNAGTYNKNNPAKFIHAKSLYYQDGGTWKEIKRTGYEVYTTPHHANDGQYYVDRHEVAYVYVDQDVTLKRQSRIGNWEDSQGGEQYGYQQRYWEKAPAMVNEWPNEPWYVNHPIIALSLKQGWNQIETVSRYPGDAGGDSTWRQIKKWVRVASGLMGPYATKEAGLTAKHSYYEDGRPAGDTPSGPSIWSDEAQAIQVPWVAQ